MSSAERRALLLLLSLAVAGQGVRYLISKPGEPPGQVQLLATLTPGAPLAQRDSAMQAARPLAPGERVDVDAASAAELARLPKVGPRLAKTILADRAEHGPFGSLEALDRVPGIGPGLLKVIEPQVTFSRKVVASPVSTLNLNTATASELDALPGIGAAKAAAILRYREEHGPFTAVEELARIPGLSGSVLSRLRERVSVR